MANPSLPKQVHKRLSSEFDRAAARIIECDDVDAKLYYFSVFFGETGRQLNTHWDSELALLHFVVRQAGAVFGARQPLPAGAGFPPDAVPEGFMQALDQVASDIAEAFQKPEIDSQRLYSALAKIGEMTYAVTGNGAFLLEKGMFSLWPSEPEQPS